MSDPFIDAYSALDARMKIVDVITNNLANANTTGFKRDFRLHSSECEPASMSERKSISPPATSSRPAMTWTSRSMVRASLPSRHPAASATRATAASVSMKTVSWSRKTVCRFSTARFDDQVGHGKVSIQDGGAVTM